MFSHNNKSFLFCLPKKGSRSHLIKAAPALGSSSQLSAPANNKIGSGSTLKVAAPGGSGSATLVLGTGTRYLIRGCGSRAGLRIIFPDPEHTVDTDPESIF